LHATLQDVRERRRALRSVLFMLLELRYEIRRREPREVVSVMTRYLVSRFGGVDEAALTTPEARAFFARAIKTMITSMEGASLAARYNEAIGKLAPYNPLLAYLLSGRDTVLKLDEALGAYFATAIADQPDSPSQAKIDEATGKMTEEIYRDALDELAKSAAEVSKQLWTLTYLRTKRILARQDEPIDSKELSKFLDSWMPSDLGPSSPPPLKAE